MQIHNCRVAPDRAAVCGATRTAILSRQSGGGCRPLALLRVSRLSIYLPGRMHMDCVTMREATPSQLATRATMASYSYLAGRPRRHYLCIMRFQLSVPGCSPTHIAHRLGSMILPPLDPHARYTMGSNPDMPGALTFASSSTGRMHSRLSSMILVMTPLGR